MYVLVCQGMMTFPDKLKHTHMLPGYVSSSTDGFFTPRDCFPTSYDLKLEDLSGAHIQKSPCFRISISEEFVSEGRR